MTGATRKTMTDTHTDAPLRYRVVGMDCAKDAAEIERAAHSAGVDEVKVSAATHIMTLRAAQTDAPRIERAVAATGYGGLARTKATTARARRISSPATVGRFGSW